VETSFQVRFTWLPSTIVAAAVIGPALVNNFVTCPRNYPPELPLKEIANDRLPFATAPHDALEVKDSTKAHACYRPARIPAVPVPPAL
jgi:hypothetical protein